MDSFAQYILDEPDFMRKVEIVYYLQKKTGIFYDKSVLFKAEIAKLFMKTMKLDVDENLVLTAALLYACKKIDNAQSIDKMKSYTKEGSEYLSKLGFSDKFCRVCEQVTRYSKSFPREKESDILELADQFGAMLLVRPERAAFDVEDAIVILEHRNLKGEDNQYLEKFKEFVNIMKEVYV